MYGIKKGRPHGHRYGKKPGRQRILSKKKCQKREFQGIHDRFLRDQEFRIRMIENHRDDFCRRWDAPSTFRTNGGFIQVSKVLILCR